jgi:hypothetical protein
MLSQNHNADPAAKSTNIVLDSSVNIALLVETDSCDDIVEYAEFEEGRFKELIQIFRNTNEKGYVGDIKATFLEELIALASNDANRTIMLNKK